MREALVNAVYHRGYDKNIVEPTKVYLYPDRIEVISYPGPVSGIDEDHLASGGSVPPVPARNRRIGEFLKELKLAEGRLTGLPQIYDAMEQNGSPTPKFDFDAGRTYFRATLPAHPEYAAVSAIQDAAYLNTVGSTREAFERVQRAWEANEASAVLAIEMIRLYAAQGQLEEAEDRIYQIPGARATDCYRQRGEYANRGAPDGWEKRRCTASARRSVRSLLRTGRYRHGYSGAPLARSTGRASLF